jgi:hypothetical protein
MYLKHGLSKTPEYKCWQQLKARCINPDHRAYLNYGGRGIRVYGAWIDDFEAFLSYVGPRPTPRHSLDRIDVDDGYRPGNVKWATWKKQANNRRPHGTAKRLRPVRTPGRKTNFKHGLIHTPEYNAWALMKDRCLNPNSSNYPNWGGRGITVCQEWVDGFTVFFHDVGPRPTPQHSLDRIDNEKGYEPGNVRWASKLQQTHNRRSCKTGPEHKNYKHGGVGSPEYKTWGSIKTRCFNTKHDGYARYGAIGITMCSRWRDNFEAFLEDVGGKPAGYKFSRSDLEGSYSCGECEECAVRGWIRNGEWRSPSEINQAKRTAKLSRKKVVLVRQRLAEGASHKELSEEFGVCVSLIGKVGRGQNWS